MDKEKLFSFHWDCGRGGDLEGVFFATQEEVDFLVGKELYLGEVLGTFGANDATAHEISDEDFAVLVRHKNLISSGYDPREYYCCKECGEALPLDGSECRHCAEEAAS